MRIFKIYGRFSQQDNSRDNNIVGYFIQEEGSKEFFGYMIELYITGSENFSSDLFKKGSVNDPIRYIKGFYNEQSRELVFLKLSNCKWLDPLIYVFYDIEKKGLWSSWSSINKKFFNPNKVNSGMFNIANGESTIEISEITEKCDEYEKKIKETYEQVIKVGLQLNMQLMNNMEEYKKYLSIRHHIFSEDENSVYQEIL